MAEIVLLIVLVLLAGLVALMVPLRRRRAQPPLERSAGAPGAEGQAVPAPGEIAPGERRPD